MGIFSRKNIIGRMQLDFINHNEVVVHDTIPDFDKNAPYPVWYAFLYAGKLLSNFPPPSGDSVVERAFSKLDKSVNTEIPLSNNFTMLGMCCEEPLKIINDNKKGKWVYSGELFYQNDNLLINTSIANGDEDHFHRASIDVVFEVVRLRLKENGGAIPFGVVGLFEVLRRNGCSDWIRNSQYCASAAILSASVAGWKAENE